MTLAVSYFLLYISSILSYILLSKSSILILSFSIHPSSIALSYSYLLFFKSIYASLS